MLTLLQGGNQERVRPEVRALYPERAAMADRMTFAREQKGLTLRQLVRITGLPYRRLEMTEAGHPCLSPDECKHLCHRLEMSLDWLMGRVPTQLDPGWLDPKVRKFVDSLPESNRERLLTLLAMDCVAGYSLLDSTLEELVPHG